MLLNNLLLAGIATVVFYYLNNQQRWYFLDDVQYFLLFVAIGLGLALVERFQGFSTRQAVGDFMERMDLVDNEKAEEVKAVVEATGEKPEVPCYGVPFKVIRTQYGDRGLLAGYNEMVEAYQQGGIDQPPPSERIYSSCMKGEDDGITVTHEVVKKPNA